jgi:hypothetical protein
MNPAHLSNLRAAFAPVDMRTLGARKPKEPGAIPRGVAGRSRLETHDGVEVVRCPQAQQLFTAAPAYVVPGPDADPAALRAHLLLQLRAGGWSDAWAARRAIQEAHEALF